VVFKVRRKKVEKERRKYKKTRKKREMIWGNFGEKVVFWR